jgi:hypothetical protein
VKAALGQQEATARPFQPLASRDSGGHMPGEALMDEVVEEPLPPRRKRRRFRKYPKPVCTEEEKAALLVYQKNICPICKEPIRAEDAVVDHSYRNSKTRGVLHRSPCNAGLGMFKDSPTRLRNALAYLRNPPAKALGFGEIEKERES